MELLKIITDMMQILKSDNNRYEIIDSEHIKDLKTNYKWHFYSNGDSHVTKDDKMILDPSMFDVESKKVAYDIGAMLRNHFKHKFISDHQAIYSQISEA